MLLTYKILIYKLDSMIGLLTEYIFTHEWNTLTDEKKRIRLQCIKKRTEQIFCDSSISFDSSFSVVEERPSPLRRTNRANAGKRNQPSLIYSIGNMHKSVLRPVLRRDF
jgi:hypothetical protein